MSTPDEPRRTPSRSSASRAARSCRSSRVRRASSARARAASNGWPARSKRSIASSIPSGSPAASASANAAPARRGGVADVPSELAELVHRRPGALRRGVDPDEQLEAGCPLEPVLGRDAPQEAPSQLLSAVAIAAVQCQLRPAEQRERMAFGLGERAPTPPRSGPAGAEAPPGARRPPVPSPVASPRASRDASRSADSASLQLPRRMSTEAYCVRQTAKNGRDVPSARELDHPGTPLGRALVVAHALARCDQPAAVEADRVEIGQLAADRGGRRLVELPHPLLDLTGADEREPVERQPGRSRCPATRVRGRSAVPFRSEPSRFAASSSPRARSRRRGVRASRARPRAGAFRAACARRCTHPPATADSPRKAS